MSLTVVSAISVAGAPWEARGDHGFGPIFPIAWLLLIIAAAVVSTVLVRRGRTQAPRRAGEARLAEEYAAGRIGADEYRTRLEVLRGQ